MDVLKVLGGILSLSFGIYYTRKQLLIFKRKEQDELGFDIKGLGAGVCFIMIGMSMILSSL
ncbi:hypothetical protein C8P68_10187 [Mucilaginibacter yixingensis]|uniref:DUF3784 domain-containing protein n=1 Tax=Mucilaginibacter yixingensis TaxID=1295612 RepID=A0A2T5JEM1_9SPHI|nr:hypothetical protein C8P68_10187 [Mucilaginibacter yixingensis]